MSRRSSSARGSPECVRVWKISLSMQSRKLELSASAIRTLVSAVLSEVEFEIARVEVCEVSVLITDDRRIRKLNREFRNKDKPTDVLSFPQCTRQQLRGRGRGFIGSQLGDIVISSDTTLRQAKSFGVTVREELVRLVVHGILHLCGYDHERVPASEAQRMRRRERAIRRRLLG